MNEHPATVDVCRQGMFYPWHAAYWQQVATMRSEKRLPHAFLVHGRRGLGKQAFAVRFSQWLLCAQPEVMGPCGHCKHCRLFTAGTHGDFLVVKPEEENSAIRIDTIRELTGNLGYRPHQAQFKVALILHADQMNLFAANSLLKSLEEPVPDTILVLVTARPGVLPITIRSRCVSLRFVPPTMQEARAWLAQERLSEPPLLLVAAAAGAPLELAKLADPSVADDFKQLQEDLAALGAGKAAVTTVAGAWAKRDVDRCSRWLLALVEEQIRRRFEPDAGTGSTSASRAKEDLSVLFSFRDQLLESRRLLLNPSYNRQMQLERVFSAWTDVYSG